MNISALKTTTNTLVIYTLLGCVFTLSQMFPTLFEPKDIWTCTQGLGAFHMVVCCCNLRKYPMISQRVRESSNRTNHNIKFNHQPQYLKICSWKTEKKNPVNITAAVSSLEELLEKQYYRHTTSVTIQSGFHSIKNKYEMCLLKRIWMETEIHPIFFWKSL